MQLILFSDNSEIESCKHLALKLCHIESATKQHKKALSKASAEETLDGFDEVGCISQSKSIYYLEPLHLAYRHTQEI